MILLDDFIKKLRAHRKVLGNLPVALIDQTCTGLFKIDHLPQVDVFLIPRGSCDKYEVLAISFRDIEEPSPEPKPKLQLVKEEDIDG